MEAPLQHQFPIPPLPQDALLQQHAVSARALLMAGAAGAGSNNKLAPPPLATANNAAAAPGPGREQCPRCASRDTKFCYYNNYNTAQPRHFCRACRRYWTLGGSLRNVPVGGSTRKRPRRPVMRPTRGAMAAAVAAAMAMPPMPSTTTKTTSASAGGSPYTVASPAATLLQGAGGGGLLLGGSMLLGSASASLASSPMLALGAAPMLEGRLGFDLGLGDAALAGAADGAAGDLAHHQTLPLGAGAIPWPAVTAAILEGDRAETMWKDASSVFPFPPAAAALWQELAAAAPVVESGGLHHGAGAPHLLL